MKKLIKNIAPPIYIVRGQRVMLDEDLAKIYGVETKVLNQAIRRNLERFPEDFMFQLSLSEFTNLKSQFVTSRWGGRRKKPFVFTEHGAVMLASVLRSFLLKQSNKTDREFKKVWNTIEKLIGHTKDTPKETIGFKLDQ